MTGLDFTTMAVRYSQDVPRLAAFFDVLGLSRRITTVDDSFVAYVAGAGLVMLHRTASSFIGLAAGQVELAFEVSDLDATVDGLAEAGLDSIHWDESYGRHAAVREPHGDGIWINERQRDLYGYQAHDPAPNDLNVLAIRFSADFATDSAFYALLGFRPRAGGSAHFQPLDGQRPAAGTIGLHPPGPDGVPAGPVSVDNPAAPPALVELSFETHHDLDALAGQLVAAGYPDARVDDRGVPRLRVTDPDGVEVQIHVATEHA